MKGTHLGEFEELVLLSIAILDENAYGISIKEEIKRKAGRNPSIGALHSAFKRLEEKGFVKSNLCKYLPEGGGRRRLYYTLSISGKKALKRSYELRNSMWNSIPKLIIDLKTNNQKKIKALPKQIVTIIEGWYSIIKVEYLHR